MGAAVVGHIMMGGGRVPEAIQVVVLKLVQVPSLVNKAVIEMHYVITGKHSALLLPKEMLIQANLVHKFPAPEDDGYLLLSGIGATEGKSIVQLIRIADGQVIAKWNPDWPEIHSMTTGHRLGKKGSIGAYRAIHPLLLSDGSIIFNTGSSLARLPLCSSKALWVLNYPYHHSIELSPTGNSVWVPSVTEVFSTDNSELKDTIRDDSLSEVSLDGRVIKNLSFSKILVDNNMTGHMIGTSGFTKNLDPIHLNQITPATSGGSFWQINDLLISARHTSTIYLYRPSTNKIIWHQQGPWLNQHSAHFVNNHSIAVFGNDVYGSYSKPSFIYKEGHNQIYQYDFENKQTQKLHSKALSEVKPITITDGRLRILEDYSIFVEDTNNSRLFKLNSKGQLVWSYINTYDENNLGIVSWSRYLTKKELSTIDNIEKADSSTKCNFD